MICSWLQKFGLLVGGILCMSPAHRWQVLGGEQVSSFVDISLQLQDVHHTMSDFELESFESTVRSLLEGGMASDFLGSALEVLQMAVLSQRLVVEQESVEGGLSSLVTTVSMYVRHEIDDYSSPIMVDVENEIRLLFESKEEDLISLLQLHGEYFSTVHTIEVLLSPQSNASELLAPQSSQWQVRLVVLIYMAIASAVAAVVLLCILWQQPTTPPRRNKQQSIDLDMTQDSLAVDGVSSIERISTHHGSISSEDSIEERIVRVPSPFRTRNVSHQTDQLGSSEKYNRRRGMYKKQSRLGRSSDRRSNEGECHCSHFVDKSYDKRSPVRKANSPVELEKDRTHQTIVIRSSLSKNVGSSPADAGHPCEDVSSSYDLSSVTGDEISVNEEDIELDVMSGAPTAWFSRIDFSALRIDDDNYSEDEFGSLANSTPGSLEQVYEV